MQYCWSAQPSTVTDLRNADFQINWFGRRHFRCPVQPDEPEADAALDSNWRNIIIRKRHLIWEASLHQLQKIPRCILIGCHADGKNTCIGTGASVPVIKSPFKRHDPGRWFRWPRSPWRRPLERGPGRRVSRSKRTRPGRHSRIDQEQACKEESIRFHHDQGTGPPHRRVYAQPRSLAARYGAAAVTSRTTGQMFPALKV